MVGDQVLQHGEFGVKPLVPNPTASENSRKYGEAAIPEEAWWCSSCVETASIGLPGALLRIRQGAGDGFNELLSFCFGDYSMIYWNLVQNPERPFICDIQINPPRSCDEEIHSEVVGCFMNAG